MKCPFCNNSDTNVKDSRTTEEAKVIRRRRFCSQCKGRFTTFERTQLRSLNVVKRSGTKKPFDPIKVAKSIATALRKRNFSDEQIEEFTNKVLVELRSATTKEIPTKKIGKLILDRLAKIDEVAYIRFASVYKDFTNIEDFTKFIKKIVK